jgi:copper transporter 1
LPFSGNWQVIGSCFLTSTWQIKTTAQFVGTCVGVFLLVVLIESIRRWGREWDRYIVRQAVQRNQSKKRGNGRANRLSRTTTAATSTQATGTSTPEKENDIDFESQQGVHQMSITPNSKSAEKAPRGAAALARIETAFFGLPKGSPGARALASRSVTFRPTVFQQAIRSLVYAIQFAGAVSVRVWQ